MLTDIRLLVASQANSNQEMAETASSSAPEIASTAAVLKRFGSADHQWMTWVSKRMVVNPEANRVQLKTGPRRGLSSLRPPPSIHEAMLVPLPEQGGPRSDRVW